MFYWLFLFNNVQTRQLLHYLVTESVRIIWFVLKFFEGNMCGGLMGSEG